MAGYCEILTSKEVVMMETGRREMRDEQMYTDREINRHVDAQGRDIKIDNT